jgi:hypothetical protein
MTVSSGHNLQSSYLPYCVGLFGKDDTAEESHRFASAVD